MPKQVSITVKKGGKTTVEAHGYSGPACEKAVAFYVNKLGGKQTHAENKPEYFDTPEAEQDQSNT